MITSARDLVRAGRWEQAGRLLDAAEPHEAHEAGAVAAARADAEVDHAFWTRREPDAAVLDTARKLAADDAQAWAADFARLRARYARELLGARTSDTAEPDTAEPDAELAADAERLARQSPDASARAHAMFYRGLIAGVLRGDDAAAEPLWRAALDTDDEYVRSYALRHLAGVAHEADRPDEALQLWRESTRLRQRVGFVPGVLAQLALRAECAPVARDWAAALGIGWVVDAVTPTDTPNATEPEVARDRG